jgi:glycosyltransferase involved in cell wall biosynthesis
MKLRVAYDVSFPAQLLRQRESQTGISRFVDEVLRALCRREEVEMSAVGLVGGDRHPIRTSVQARAYFEAMGFPGCGVSDTFRSRFGLLRGYAGRVQRQTVGAPHAALDPAAVKSTPAKPRRRTIPEQMIRRLASYAVGIDIVQTLQPGRFDVFHATCQSLPSRSVTGKTTRIATIHDIFPILQPGAVLPIVAQDARKLLASIDPKRDWVVCVSDHTKKEFCHYTGMSPARVFVTPEAAAEHFRPERNPDVLATTRQRYGIPNGPYFLTVSNPQPRKNLPFLIRAFSRLLREQPEVDANLVLVGSKKLGWMNQELELAVAECPELQGRITFTGYVDEADLAAIYSGASAFVFPSLHEGFGLPPLEAMACGVPIISSNASSLPEVVGDAGVLIDPKDGNALGQALWQIHRDRTFRETLAARSLARAAMFSWDKCAGQLTSVYRTAAAGNGL